MSKEIKTKPPLLLGAPVVSVAAILVTVLMVDYLGILAAPEAKVVRVPSPHQITYQEDSPIDWIEIIDLDSTVDLGYIDKDGKGSGFFQYIDQQNSKPIVKKQRLAHDMDGMDEYLYSRLDSPLPICNGHSDLSEVPSIVVSFNEFTVMYPNESGIFLSHNFNLDSFSGTTNMSCLMNDTKNCKSLNYEGNPSFINMNITVQAPAASCMRNGEDRSSLSSSLLMILHSGLRKIIGLDSNFNVNVYQLPYSRGPTSKDDYDHWYCIEITTLAILLQFSLLFIPMMKVPGTSSMKKGFITFGWYILEAIIINVIVLCCLMCTKSRFVEQNSFLVLLIMFLVSAALCSSFSLFITIILPSIHWKFFVLFGIFIINVSLVCMFSSTKYGGSIWVGLYPFGGIYLMMMETNGNGQNGQYFRISDKDFENYNENVSHFIKAVVSSLIYVVFWIIISIISIEIINKKNCKDKSINDEEEEEEEINTNENNEQENIISPIHVYIESKTILDDKTIESVLRKIKSSRLESSTNMEATFVLDNTIISLLDVVETLDDMKDNISRYEITKHMKKQTNKQ